MGDFRAGDFFAGRREADFFADLFADFFAGLFAADFLAGALFALRFALFFAPPFRAEGRDLPDFLPAFFLAAMTDGSCR